MTNIGRDRESSGFSFSEHWYAVEVYRCLRCGCKNIWVVDGIVSKECPGVFTHNGASIETMEQVKEARQYRDDGTVFYMRRG